MNAIILPGSDEPPFTRKAPTTTTAVMPRFMNRFMSGFATDIVAFVLRSTAASEAFSRSKRRHS